MNAEIMAVGTELLLGDIVNTNAQYLAKELALLGFGIYRQTTVGDNEVRLEIALKEALKEADIVITTGGLGPTPDDITKEISAKVFSQELVLHELDQRPCVRVGGCLHGCVGFQQPAAAFGKVVSHHASPCVIGEPGPPAWVSTWPRGLR